jgi:proline iminopeptidase
MTIREAEQTSAGPRRKGLGWRLLRRAGRGIVFVLAVVLGVALAAVTFVVVAVLTTSIAPAVMAALMALAAVTFAASRRATRARPGRRGHLVAGAVAGALVVVVSVTAAVTLFRPASYPYTPATATTATRFWSLPNGGRIAYTLTPAARPTNRSPVVFLHGGPGVPGEPGRTVLSAPDGLARDGFDVYVYDQVGAGLSSRLDDARDYTVDRHVADLEAIRQQIGAQKLILVGHSWGGILAARYLAAHTDRVERVVFETPAELWTPAQSRAITAGVDEQSAQQRALTLRLLTPRVLLTNLLGDYNIQAARRFAGDREMDGFDQQASPLQPAPTCDRTADVRFPPGMGYYVGVGTNNSLNQVADPRPVLRNVQTPALVISAECDFLDWPLAREYRDTLPNSRLVHVPDAGHLVQVDQPALLLDTVRAFLLDRDLPLPAYTGSERPNP